MLGGWLSGRLLRAGWSLCRARKFALAAGAALLPTAILAPLVPGAPLAIAATSIVVFGHAVWVANLLTLPADLFPGSEVGTASGFTGMAGSIGGILANLGTGYIVSTFSYLPVFIAAGLLHPIACFLLWRYLTPRMFEQNG